MLGGPVYIAVIRFVVSFAGVCILYSRLSESRFEQKKTIMCYGCFCAVMILLSSIWYAVDRESCVRIAALVMYMCFAALSIFMSKDSVYLSMYKLALTFYLLAVFLIGGVETAVLFFDRNVWVDIAMRVILVLLMSYFIEYKLKSIIRGFGDYVERELDNFSVWGMIISILLGISFILNPSLKGATSYRLYQVVTNFILTGMLQLLMFRLYLHLGKEKEYERENQLIQMNHRLLERQMEILEESVEAGKRVRHDIRHHNAVIAEYARRGQNEELLQYIEEYSKETKQGIAEVICANTAVNNILSAYTRKAKNEDIRVTLQVELGREQTIPNIDLIAILANAYENAIYACMNVKKHPDGRECFIHLMIKKKRNKLIISCRNTCKQETQLKDGKPKVEFTGGIGISSIIKAAEKYDGEYDFKSENGVFVFRLVMNIPSKKFSDEKERTACIR